MAPGLAANTGATAATNRSFHGAVGLTPPMLGSVSCTTSPPPRSRFTEIMTSRSVATV